MGIIKVSVLTYVKNDASHIEQCMRSVMAQDMAELEYLVIDGGSTDGTREKIENLSKEDRRIRIIDTNPGLGHQLNIGIRNATGEYIGICESDDYLLPGMYSFQYDIAHKEKLDVLRADAYDFFTVNGEEHRIPFSLPGVSRLKNILLAGDDARQAIKIGVNRFFSGLYKREFLMENELFMNETPGAAYQDNTFAFLTLIKAERIYISDKPFYCYRLDNPNASCNSPDRLNMVDVEYRLLQERLENMKEWDLYKETYLSWMILNHFWFCNLLEGDFRKNEVEIFYNSLKELSDRYKFSEDKLRSQDLKVLSVLMASKDEFEKMVLDTCARIESARDAILSVDQKERIVIFGAGNIGRLVMYALKKKGIYPVGFVDNNENLWGKHIEGIPVLPPQKMCVKEKQAKYVVANVEHNFDIRKQLQGYGVDEKEMIVCDSYDFTVRKILMGA